MLDKNFFKDIGPDVREKYRTHVFTKGLDVNDQKFKSYKEPYKSLKSAGKLFRQSGGTGGSTAPVVSTDLMRDFGSIFKTSNNGFQMGWSVYGVRVEGLAKRGRVLTSKEKALPQSVSKFLEVEGDKYIKKKLGPNKTTRHRIGK